MQSGWAAEELCLTTENRGSCVSKLQGFQKKGAIPGDCGSSLLQFHGFIFFNVWLFQPHFKFGVHRLKGTQLHLTADQMDWQTPRGCFSGHIFKTSPELG